MKEIHFKAVSGSPDSVAWHDWRGGGVGGSDACVIASAHRLCSRPSWAKKIENLLSEKAGLAFDTTPMNWAMKRGRDGEVAARLAFEAQTGIPVSPAFGENDQYPWIRSSFDGLSFDQREIVEIKCPGARAHDAAKNGVIPDYYLVQMAHQAIVAWGQPSCWDEDPGRRIYYASYRPEDDNLAVVAVDPVELAALAGRYLPVLIRFWDDVLRAKSAKAKGEAVTVSATPNLSQERLGDVEAAAREFIRLSAEAEELNTRLDELRKTLLLAANEAGGRLEAWGVLAYKTEVKGSIDYPKAIKALGINVESLEAYRKPASSREYVKKAGAAQ